MSSGAIVFVLMLALSKDVTAASIVGGLIFLVVWALVGAAIRGEMLKRAKRAVAGDLTTPALGAHTLEITPSKITETCPHHKLSTGWDAAERVFPVGHTPVRATTWSQRDHYSYYRIPFRRSTL